MQVTTAAEGTSVTLRVKGGGIHLHFCGLQTHRIRTLNAIQELKETVQQLQMRSIAERAGLLTIDFTSAMLPLFIRFSVVFVVVCLEKVSFWLLVNPFWSENDFPTCMLNLHHI